MRAAETKPPVLPEADGPLRGKRSRRRLRDVPCTMCELVDRPDRRVVDLSPFGFPEIPVVGETYAPRTTHGSIFHRHAGCIEITLCVKGSAKFDCIDRVCSLLPGQVFASQPDEVHRLRMNQKGISLFWLFFRVPAGRGPHSVLGLPSDETAHLLARLRTLPRRSFAVGDEAKEAFAALFRAYDLPERPAGAKSLAIRIAVLRLFAAILLAERGARAADPSADAPFVRLIREMRHHPEDPFDVDRLIRETGFSPNTILSRFRRLTGLAPGAFLTRCRISRSKELLAKSGQSITEIACQLGFASSQHFATRFRQETGQSPSEWRDVQKNAK